MRPGYTTLQELISNALTAERDRLEQQVEATLTDAAREALQQLLVREDSLSELAALKQDAKSFRYRQMGLERQKRLTLKPLYGIAKMLLPSLDVSQLNIAYYASLANFYTIDDLRRFKSGQTNLYLLCYAWQRQWQGLAGIARMDEGGLCPSAILVQATLGRHPTAHDPHQIAELIAEF